MQAKHPTGFVKVRKKLKLPFKWLPDVPEPLDLPWLKPHAETNGDAERIAEALEFRDTGSLAPLAAGWLTPGGIPAFVPPKPDAEGLILRIELIPSPLHYRSLRSYTSEATWRAIAREVYVKGYYRCELCGGQGKKHPVEAHETWSYSELPVPSFGGKMMVQKLERISCLCPTCHSVKHFGATSLRSKIEWMNAKKQFCKVNQCKAATLDDHIVKSFDEWDDRNKAAWVQDLTNVKKYTSTEPIDGTFQPLDWGISLHVFQPEL